GDIAARGLVELDQLGAGGDEALQLGVDHLGEALGNLDHALVRTAGMDPRAERERPRTRRLERALRVSAQELEVPDEAEARGRHRPGWLWDPTTEVASGGRWVMGVIISQRRRSGPDRVARATRRAGR